MAAWNLLGPKKKPVSIDDLENQIYDVNYERQSLMQKMEKIEKAIFRNIDKLAEAEGFKTEILIQDIALQNLEMELYKADFAFSNDLLSSLTKVKAMAESEKLRGDLTRKLSKQQLVVLNEGMEQAAEQRRAQEKSIQRMREQVEKSFSRFTATPTWNEDLSELRGLAESMQNARAKGTADAESQTRTQILSKLQTMFRDGAV